MYPCIKKYYLVVLIAALTASCSAPKQQLTKDEAVEFAKELQQNMAKGNGSFLDEAFDKKEFTKRMNLPDDNEARGYARGVMQKLTIGSQITNALTDKDNFSFVKHYVKNDTQHVLFRLYTDNDGSLNYHDYELMKSGDKCKIADVYIYMSGETLAETLGNLYTIFSNHASSSNKSLSPENLDGLEDFKRLKDLVQKGKSAEAKEIFDKLPLYLRNTKIALLMNTRICSNLENEKYSKAIALYKEHFPNEPNLNMIMIDGYFLQKDYTSALNAINALDSQINKDPLLDYYRYLSYNLLQDSEHANACLKKVVGTMPDFQKGFLELIAVNLEAKNNKAADSLIAIYRKKAKFSQEDLTRVVSYYR